MGVVLGYPSFPRPCSTVPSQAASALLGSAERKARQELSCSAYNFYPAPPLAQKVPLILPRPHSDHILLASVGVATGSTPSSHRPPLSPFNTSSVIYLYPHFSSSSRSAGRSTVSRSDASSAPLPYTPLSNPLCHAEPVFTVFVLIAIYPPHTYIPTISSHFNTACIKKKSLSCLRTRLGNRYPQRQRVPTRATSA